MASLILLTFMHSVMAVEITTIPQVGPHFRILTLEKNENPQNILAIYTKLNGACEIEDDSKSRPVLDYYWLMDRQRYKPLNLLIRRGVSRRLSLAPQSNKNSFSLNVNDLRELKTDIANPSITVTSRKTDTGCVAQARMQLGPSDGERTLLLTGIYSESSKTFLPPFRKLLSLTLEGIDAKTGEVVRKTYSH